MQAALREKWWKFIHGELRNQNLVPNWISYEMEGLIFTIEKSTQQSDVLYLHREIYVICIIDSRLRWLDIYEV